MSLLALDVGNSSITIGIFRGKDLIKQGRISTRSSSLYEKRLKFFSRSLFSDVSGMRNVILSSVVPQATRALKKTLKKLYGFSPLVVGENIKAPIVNRYRIPSQVGQDRLVNAVAAVHLYGGPAIIVDFGTGVTFDVVSSKKEYLGGLIVPGMEIASEALTSRAALLPRIKMKAPSALLGRDTVSSMQAGLFYGYGALCDGIVKGLQKKYARTARVIGTGGHIRLIAPYCRSIQHVVPELTLLGLELVARTDAEKS